MIQYNIYYGTIGNCKYQFTKTLRNEQEAEEFAKNCAISYFYKNEGKHGLPNYNQIFKESEITGVSAESLYKEHIDDIMRWYAIPTNADTVTYNKLKF